MNDFDMHRLGIGLVELLVREGRLARRERAQPQPQSRTTISAEQLVAFEQMLHDHAAVTSMRRP